MINNRNNLYSNEIIHLKKSNNGYMIYKPKLNGISKPKDILPYYPLKDSIIFKNNNIKKDNLELPIFCQWFDKDSIHQIEIENIPDFFNNTSPSKNENTYKFIRNFIIDLYLLNPKEFLTFTTIRRSLNGDIGSLLLIYKFLNTWFLINYNAENNNVRIKELLNLNLFLPYYKFDKNNKYEIKEMIESDITINPNDLNCLYNYQREICVNCENICGFTWMQKTIKKDEFIKESDTVVCMECFNNDKLPLLYSREEYERRSISKDKLVKPWSTEEREKLIEIFKNSKENLNFDELFENFKNRKKEEVILEILKLPNEFIYYKELTLKKDLNINNMLKSRKDKFKKYLNALNLNLNNFSNGKKDELNNNNDINNVNQEKDELIINNKNHNVEVENNDKNYSSIKNTFNSHLDLLKNKIKFIKHLEDIVIFDKMKLKFIN